MPERAENRGENSPEGKKKLRVLLRTFGCQMNVRDSEVICGLLKKEGYKLTDESREADIVLFNTCSVRQHAEDKVWSEIGRITKQPKRGQSSAGAVPLVGLVGCMAQNYKEKIFQRSPQVDFVVGPLDIEKIPQIVFRLTEKRRQSPIPRHIGMPGMRLSAAKSADSPLFSQKIWETEGEMRPEEIYHTGFYEDKNHAYVVISEGCSNYCSYCVVPYVRGALRSRNYQDILKEIEEAVNKGITRITLLGQNVNAYQDDGHNFVELTELVNSVKRLKEFSFITSHPKDTSLELFKAMAELEKLKKHLHLPVQSGADRILKLMQRGYTRKFYLDLADNYRKIVKPAVLTTDIIVGFPSEKEEDFRDTYNLLKEVEFDAAYIFKYSPRPHTQAENLADDVSKQEKERRHQLILKLQKSISNRIHAKKSN